MSNHLRSRALGSMLLALGAAEAGARLLAPRANEIEPAAVHLRSYFTSQEIERGARFARGQLALGLAQGLVELAILGALVRRPEPTPGARRPPKAMRLRRPPLIVRPRGGRPVAASAVDGGALAIALSVAGLPLAAVVRRRGSEVGLVTQSWREWGVDIAKATAIQAALAGAGAGAVTAAARRHPRGWWAPVGLGSVLADALLVALAPVILDPIFNDFTPLPGGEVRSDVLALASAAGVEVGEVYSVDASRRTMAANAYVTGLGPTKRVVLFDTLLGRYTRDEIRLVVAHELAHVRHRDVQRGVAYASLAAPAAALAVQRLSWTMSPERGTPAALPALALATAMVAAPLGILGNRLSRAVERRADAFSLELTGAPDAFVSLERRIALQNVADLDPPRWVTILLASHPPTAERIGAALTFAAPDSLAKSWSEQAGRAVPEPHSSGSGSSP